MSTIADFTAADCGTNEINTQANFSDNCDVQAAAFSTLIINTGDTITDWNDSATITAAIAANTLRVIKKGVTGQLNETEETTISLEGRSRMPPEIVKDQTHSATASIPHRLANKPWTKKMMANPGQITQFAWVTESGSLYDPNATPTVKITKGVENEIEVLFFNASWKFNGDPAEEYPALASVFGTN